jgi:hypothetical protein
MPNNPTQDFAKLWAAAIDAYQRKANIDLDEVDALGAFLACDTPEDILRVLEDDMRQFKAFRDGDPKWAKLRDRMKSMVRIVLVLTDSMGEVASSLVCRSKIVLVCSNILQSAPGGKAIFVAFSVLLAVSSQIFGTASICRLIP